MAAAWLAALSAGAWAQEPRTPEPEYVAPDRAASASLTPIGPSAADEQPSADLAQRVEALENELKKAKEKEEAAKRKAALKLSAVPFGRIQYDGAVFDQSGGSKVQFPTGFANGVEFRRARIGVKGEGFQAVDYQIEVDFAGRDSDSNGQSTLFKDTYVGVHGLPWLGHIWAGHFKEPFGMEQLTSDNLITFMERSLSDEGAFVPARNLGAMAFNSVLDQRASWALGFFATDTPDNPAIFQNDNGGWSTTARVTFLPWYDEAAEGRRLWHVGAAYSFRDVADGTALRFRARPEAHLAPSVVDTGSMTNAVDFQLLGLETALLYGPFSLQSEYYLAWVDRSGADNLAFNGAYVFVSYLLTGEHRTYRRDRGCFDRVHPDEDFFRLRTGDGCVVTGPGAWELAYRYSFVDLRDADIQGGVVHDHTIGLNWYLNPFTRVMWNYVQSDVTRTLHGANQGTVGIFEMRVQIDF